MIRLITASSQQLPGNATEGAAERPLTMIQIPLGILVDLYTAPHLYYDSKKKKVNGLTYLPRPGGGNRSDALLNDAQKDGQMVKVSYCADNNAQENSQLYGGSYQQDWVVTGKALRFLRRPVHLLKPVKEERERLHQSKQLHLKTVQTKLVMEQLNWQINLLQVKKPA